MIFSYLLNMQSHPSWVCGLKHISGRRQIIYITSHPSWVCGLKHAKFARQHAYYRHTLRGCVD